MPMLRLLKRYAGFLIVLCLLYFPSTYKVQQSDSKQLCSKAALLGIWGSPTLQITTEEQRKNQKNQSHVHSADFGGQQIPNANL